MAASASNAPLGEPSWRILAWICTAGHFLAGGNLGLVRDQGESLRRFAAKTWCVQASPSAELGRSTHSCGQLRQSLRLEAACSRLFLSLEPLFDGSHRRVSVAQL